MEIGNKIKNLRINKGLTQEALANSLGVTYQAVSRWENSITLPDISLLPDIAVFFGVTIDELFEFTTENRFERIENMLNEKSSLSDSEFDSAKNFLVSHLRSEPQDLLAIKLMARLYEHRAKSYSALASDFAKQALTLGDTSKSMNNILRDANSVPHSDWNCRNHHKLVDFYFNHIERHPDDLTACRYLINTLIADGRTAETREILTKIQDKESDVRLRMCEVRILYKNGEKAAAEKMMSEILENHQNDWLCCGLAADICAEECKYDEAIALYERSFTLQPSPKYTDSFEAISHIYEIKKDCKKAIEYTKRIIEVLRDEWNVTFGASVDMYKARIEELTFNN